jgi:hypothetical protein
MARISIWNGPPADAAQYKSLRWVKETLETKYPACLETNPRLAGRFYVTVWRGKALKPFANYMFLDEANADDFIRKCHVSEDARIDRTATRKAEDAARTAERAAEIHVGSILHYSWGYDQTNTDFFEVVEKHGLAVVIREIASRIVPGSEGFMCESRCPAPGDFIGKPMRKRIGPYGISMAHGTASVVQPWEKHYTSHYA